MPTQQDLILRSTERENEPLDFEKSQKKIQNPRDTCKLAIDWHANGLSHHGSVVFYLIFSFKSKPEHWWQMRKETVLNAVNWQFLLFIALLRGHSKYIIRLIALVNTNTVFMIKYCGYLKSILNLPLSLRVEHALENWGSIQKHILVF